MRVLILNQPFHPDVVATAQHAADLSLALTAAGHQVTVLASGRAYDEPRLRFASRERWRGVEIQRVGCLSLARNAAWKRLATSVTFLLCSAFRVWFLPRPDLVIALTTPPLISVLGALVARLRGSRLLVWLMDLNPDEAVAAGWLRNRSLTVRCLRALLRFSLHASDRVVVLDRFMRNRLIAYGLPFEKTAIVPPWPHSNDIAYDAPAREAFRRKHGLSGRFIVMYSGNHSPCHPLDTLLSAAQRLASRKDIGFCFVGGGSEFEKVRRFAAGHNLNNITCIGYQPRHDLSASLSAADLHVVVMGDPFVGVVHPCKVYNVLALGIPMLYIGPDPSPILEVASRTVRSYRFSHARHADVSRVAAEIVKAADARWAPHPAGPDFSREYSQDALIERFLSILPNPRKPESEIFQASEGVQTL